MDTRNIQKVLLLFLLIYVFLVSIQLMGASFKLFGKDFAELLITTTSDPLAGLFIGIVATSIIQSSSTTTSIVVGLVAVGGLSLENAIPIIMGANIGTTVTNTIVSIMHVTRKQEFERAFAASVVHDFFNIMAVLVLFPLEMTTHVLEKSATLLSDAFVGAGGMKFIGPLDYLVKPAVKFVAGLTGGSPITMFVLSLIMLFLALKFMVDITRSLMMTQFEVMIDRYLFKNAPTAFVLGIMLTILVQSSSVTTSIIIPLVGAGILTVRKIFPYTLGSNIGTTVTAMMAALITLNPAAVTVAFTHLLFNIFGVVLIYPFREIPIRLAIGFAKIVAKSKKHAFVFLFIYFALHIIPLIFILAFK
ncbi:MAG: Na/Pi symporter [Candidatus Altiarchaeales archaeon]|nr:Na/Pi symporter [Candidatus Altiarchaeota archaeon]MBU4342296.1 Na/Pi symporter [Candidatus Altiarchaeota archaeon]MBU4437473.1 Na/Pi symporter [Candidatus Altiarchaeota archaeon]MCG2782041.1 Na/Pi symporter [Candidatus Altiarchaeales archaeon]